MHPSHVKEFYAEELCNLLEDALFSDIELFGHCPLGKAERCKESLISIAGRLSCLGGSIVKRAITKMAGSVLKRLQKEGKILCPILPFDESQKPRFIIAVAKAQKRTGNGLSV